MNKMEKIPLKPQIRMTGKQLRRLFNNALNSTDRNSYLTSAEYTFRSIGRPADADVLKHLINLLSKDELEMVMFFIATMPN